MPERKKARIALAQFPITADFAANLEMGGELVQEAASAGACFIGFTELAFRPFFPQFPARQEFFAWAEDFDGPTVAFFRQAAAAHKIDCAVNFFERAGHARFYDTTVICRPDGQVLGPVRMMHAAEEPGYNEKYYYWPGDTPPRVFDLGYAKIGVAICYDRHFPEYTRTLVLQDAELLFSPFAGLTTDPMKSYVVEMRGLAFQNQVYVACVNRVGQEEQSAFAGGSFIVSPDGAVQQQASLGEEALLLCDLDFAQIDAARIRRPFLRDRRPRFYREFFRQ